MVSRAPVIYLIGSDSALAYLLERYAERGGYELHTFPAPPDTSQVANSRPAVLLFSSIEDLEAAQSHRGRLSRTELPLLVCSAVNDESRARELGADQCLTHPLTYDGFLAALRAAHVLPDR